LGTRLIVTAPPNDWPDENIHCMKPFAESCEQNKAPILAVLRGIFADRKLVLEIGSGTGQHAAYFARHLPHLTWQPSDLIGNHAGINAWREDAGPGNVLPPLELDVAQSEWPDVHPDAVFSANAVHIMSWPHVECMFAGIGRVLDERGMVALYGPFNYQGRYTSDSNARFDSWLKARDPSSGIRDFEALDTLARAEGLVLTNDFEMPANNRILAWRRR
jgi:SAM-dependent methyltransferase